MVSDRLLEQGRAFASYVQEGLKVKVAVFVMMLKIPPTHRPWRGFLNPPFDFHSPRAVVIIVRATSLFAGQFGVPSSLLWVLHI